MKTLNVTEHLDAMQRMLLPTSGMSEALRGNACSFWQNQDRILDAMQAFADGWFERRRAGTSAALEAAQRMCKAETPVDLAREYQEWANGAFQRVMADGLACQQECMAVIGAVAPPLLAPGSETQAGAPAEARATARIKAA